MFRIQIVKLLICQISGTYVCNRYFLNCIHVLFNLMEKILIYLKLYIKVKINVKTFKNTQYLHQKLEQLVNSFLL